MVSFHVWDSSSGKSRVERSLVPCGCCECCIASTASEWQTRLRIEYENSSTAYFVTLTYDEDHLPVGSFSDSFGELHVVPYVCKKHVQDFFKRLRWRFQGSEIRYFLGSEYGPCTHRPHYHFVVFGLPVLFDNPKKQIVKIIQHLQKLWPLGAVTVDPVTEGRIAYVTKYITCVTDLPEYYPPPFRLMSKGLGKSYMDKVSRIDWHRSNLANFIPFGKSKLTMPRYLKTKIFDSDMMEQLREKSEVFRKERLTDLIARSESFGYKDYRDYLEDQSKSFMRKFNNKMKKNRKDL